MVYRSIDLRGISIPVDHGGNEVSAGHHIYSVNNSVFVPNAHSGSALGIFLSIEGMEIRTPTNRASLGGLSRLAIGEESPGDLVGPPSLRHCRDTRGDGWAKRGLCIDILVYEQKNYELAMRSFQALSKGRLLFVPNLG